MATSLGWRTRSVRTNCMLLAFCTHVPSKSKVSAGTDSQNALELMDDKVYRLNNLLVQLAAQSETSYTYRRESLPLLGSSDSAKETF
jgi:hypothetical protein